MNSAIEIAYIGTPPCRDTGVLLILDSPRATAVLPDPIISLTPEFLYRVQALYREIMVVQVPIRVHHTIGHDIFHPLQECFLLVAVVKPAVHSKERVATARAGKAKFTIEASVLSLASAFVMDFVPRMVNRGICALFVLRMHCDRGHVLPSSVTFATNIEVF